MQSLQKEMKKELGKWLLDIAKYMTTAVLLTSLFSGFEQWSWFLYALVVLAVFATLVLGLYLMK